GHQGLAHAPRAIAVGPVGLGGDLLAHAVDLEPAGHATHLVEADLLLDLPAVTPVLVVLLPRHRERRLVEEVPRDAGVVGLEGAADGLQPFEDVPAQRTDEHLVDAGPQRPAPPEVPDVGSPG